MQSDAVAPERSAGGEQPRPQRAGELFEGSPPGAGDLLAVGGGELIVLGAGEERRASTTATPAPRSRTRPPWRRGIAAARRRGPSPPVPRAPRRRRRPRPDGCPRRGAARLLGEMRLADQGDPARGVEDEQRHVVRPRRVVRRERPLRIAHLAAPRQHDGLPKRSRSGWSSPSVDVHLEAPQHVEERAGRLDHDVGRLGEDGGAPPTRRRPRGRPARARPRPGRRRGRSCRRRRRALSTGRPARAAAGRRCPCSSRAAAAPRAPSGRSARRAPRRLPVRRSAPARRARPPRPAPRGSGS